jgi:ATP-dependent DNA helicase RecQ
MDDMAHIGFVDAHAEGDGFHHHRASATAAKVWGVDAADAPLLEALRAWRRERAAEQRVPPYVIFHEATLMAIARERPASTDALAKISGVGQSKLKRYGDEVLKVVRAN